MSEHFDFRNELVSENDKELDRQLRPLNFGDFSGQTNIVEI
jgi:Holliday junction resolvasome RuvABC ATP-dependent DNA helicase subunit